MLIMILLFPILLIKNNDLNIFIKDYRRLLTKILIEREEWLIIFYQEIPKVLQPNRELFIELSQIWSKVNS